MHIQDQRSQNPRSDKWETNELPPLWGKRVHFLQRCDTKRLPVLCKRFYTLANTGRTRRSQWVLKGEREREHTCFRECKYKGKRQLEGKELDVF